MGALLNDALKESILTICTTSILLFLSGAFAYPQVYFTTNQEQGQTALASILANSQGQSTGNESNTLQSALGLSDRMQLSDVQDFQQQTISYNLLDKFINYLGLFLRIATIVVLGTVGPLIIYIQYAGQLFSYGALIGTLFTFIMAIWQYSVFYQIAKIANKGVAPW